MGNGEWISERKNANKVATTTTKPVISVSHSVILFSVHHSKKICLFSLHHLLVRCVSAMTKEATPTLMTNRYTTAVVSPERSEPGIVK